MTSRSKPSHSRTWDDRERRNMLLNIGFGLTIVAALLLLLVAWGVSWYSDHLSAAATVNGQTITRDAWNKAVAINEFRGDYQLRRIRTQLAAGQISAADAESRQALVQSRLQQVDSLSLEQLVDGMIQAQLAADKGVTVSAADIDARLTEEATTPELRHAWMIAVAPELEEGATQPTDAAVAAAKAIAAKALADLRAGGDWDTIAKEVSTDASRDKAGDIGFIDENASLDAAFRAALIAAQADTPTEVVEGSDGTFRVGRVSEIVAPVVDATLAQQVQDAGIGLEDFRAALGRDVTRGKLSDAIVAQYLAPSPHRHVSEIFMQASASETGPGAVRTRHILYSPNDDPAAAAELPETDAGWAAAQAEAEAAHARLVTDISLFDSIARAESDEDSAVTTGGKLPYFSTEDGLDEAFAAAIFAEGLQPAQLLAPVRSSFGWHVIQVMHYPTDAEWAAKLKTDIDAGTQSFADAARDNSDNAEAAQGGEIGWVSEGQLEPTKEAAVFAAPIGEVSDPLTVPNEGIYLFLVDEEQTREPDADQQAALETAAFPRWYSEQKATFEITRDPGILGQTS
jgi:parvulin-like peptidyl-prolyl isomerase